MGDVRAVGVLAALDMDGTVGNRQSDERSMQMKILHVVPGLEQYSNGIAVAAKAIADFQRTEGHEVDCIEAVKFASSDQDISGYTEVWVHSNWWPPTLRACWKVVRAGVPLVRMTHANLDPLRYHSKWFKKALVSPFERWLYRHTSRVVVTCDAEREWCRSWGVKCPFEVFDLKQLFDLSKHPVVSRDGSAGLRCCILAENIP